jgi:hypothetical protein
MRKRQLKKFAKNAKKNMTPYRKARGKGSKKDCRRLKAFNRLSRRIKQDHIYGLGACTALLEQIDARRPADDYEASRLSECKLRVQDKLQHHRDAVQFDEEMRSLKHQMTVMKQVMSGYIGGFKMPGSVG